jgi:hypothetical protein
VCAPMPASPATPAADVSVLTSPSTPAVAPRPAPCRLTPVCCCCCCCCCCAPSVTALAALLLLLPEAAVEEVVGRLLGGKHSMQPAHDTGGTCCLLAEMHATLLVLGRAWSVQPQSGAAPTDYSQACVWRSAVAAWPCIVKAVHAGPHLSALLAATPGEWEATGVRSAPAGQARHMHMGEWTQQAGLCPCVAAPWCPGKQGMCVVRGCPTVCRSVPVSGVVKCHSCHSSLGTTCVFAAG